METGTRWILQGSLFLFISLIWFISSQTMYKLFVFIPLAIITASGGLIIITFGIFENRHYYNIVSYLSASGIILTIMLILIYTLRSTLISQYNEFYYYVIIGISILLSVHLIISFSQRIHRQRKLFQLYDKSLEINPQDTSTLNNKGVALSDLKEYQQALKSFDKVIEIDPQDAAAWHNKGVMLDKLGKHREALEYFDKALKVDPGFKNAKKSGKIILES